MNSTLKEKEEFRRLYKEYKIATTGQWTKEDEEALDKECSRIEAKSALISSCIVGFMLALIIILLWILLGV